MYIKICRNFSPLLAPFIPCRGDSTNVVADENKIPGANQRYNRSRLVQKSTKSAKNKICPPEISNSSQSSPSLWLKCSHFQKL